ncbi:MAG TPA: outer membrane beta-barrel protein [Vicinamibacterales bacterium]|nr:outer membrane beta-barrel protein [Vicinamibacterales bacterium]
MRRWILAVCVGIAFASAAPAASTPAGAQQRPISIGLAGGVSLPQGDLAAGANTGWHALGTLALSTLMQPLGMRLDVAYNRFGLSDVDGNQSVGSATLYLTYRLPMTNSPMSPYLISGLGAYRSDCSATDGCEASTRFGWNVGLGTKLYVGFRSFIEVRYHRTARGDASVNYFPLTFGVLF